MGLRLSIAGLAKIDAARRKKKWSKQSYDWYAQAGVSLSVLKRFLGKEVIGKESFISLCQVVGIENWQEVVADEDEVESAEVIKNPKRAKPPDRAEICKSPLQNLPHQTNEFIGRKSELERLLKALSFEYRTPIVTIDGIGGVGKTAIAIEAAYLCLEYRLLLKSGIKPNAKNYPAHIKNLAIAPTPFEAIIFTSAKADRLLPIGIQVSLQRHRGLRDIFQAIANTLNDKSITQTLTFEEQLQRVRNSLAAQSTLLIVDNFETLNDKDDVLSFLSELPNSTKAIITSREKTIIHVPLRLECLSDAESLQLINQQIAEKNISLTEAQIQQIQQRFGGMPIAIIYVIGQIANGTAIADLVNPDIPLPADICQFCFESAIAPLRGKPAHLLLMALAMFASPPMPSALIAVAGLTDDSSVESGLEILRSLSLISQMPDGQRYGMLSLTREYTLSEIAKYADLEALMRDRWIQWHLKYAETYGGKDWDDWYIRYDHLEAEWSNLSSVLTWCAERDRYTEVRDLGFSLSYYLYLYGHWDNGLVILAWMTEGAERREDWATVFRLMDMNGWILLLMDRLDEAEYCLFRGWELREYAVPIDLFCLIDNIGILRMRQMRLDEALKWVEKEEEIAQTLAEQDRDRSLIYSACTRGEVDYLQGEYNQAETHYRRAFDLAKQVGWQRYANYAQNWLADIAIAQGNLAEAEKLLYTGLIAAERNKDLQRIATYHRTYARLEQARHNLDKSQEWALKACKSFESLGMLRQAKEMKALLI